MKIVRSFLRKTLKIKKSYCGVNNKEDLELTKL
mgnify:CR=1 FL=1